MHHEINGIFLCSVPVEMLSLEIEYCPSDIRKDIELGTPSIPVYWSQPIAADVSGNVTLVSHSHSSGDLFTVGMHHVLYRFTDEGRNEATCTFYVIIDGGNKFNNVFN